jgi:hypothetical protein
MCEYTIDVAEALLQLASERDEFDMLQVRDLVRTKVRPGVHVFFRECKFEALAFFEEKSIPGFVLTTKVIHLDPAGDEDENYDPTGKRVFSFAKLSTIQN